LQLPWAAPSPTPPWSFPGDKGGAPYPKTLVKLMVIPELNVITQ